MEESPETMVPGMTENDLKISSTGTYQSGQPVPYLADMLDDNDAISENLWYHRGDTNSLEIKVQSRHRSSEEWRCYVDDVPDSTSCAGIRRAAASFLRVPQRGSHRRLLFTCRGGALLSVPRALSLPHHPTS